MSNVKTPNQRMAQAARADQKTAASGKKGKTGLIILLVAIVLVLGFAAMVVFNAFGIRDGIVNAMRNIPFIGSFISPADDALTPEEIWALREEELEAQVADLERRLAQSIEALAPTEAERDFLQGLLGESEMELAVMLAMYDFVIEWWEVRETLETETVEDNIEAFMAFFEMINPDLAERLYEQQIATRLRDESRSHYVAVWSGMTPLAAAQAIEEMVTTDMRLIVDALSDMTPQAAAAIAERLSVETRSAVMRHLEP